MSCNWVLCYNFLHRSETNVFVQPNSHNVFPIKCCNFCAIKTCNNDPEVNTDDSKVLTASLLRLLCQTVVLTTLFDLILLLVFSSGKKQVYGIASFINLYHIVAVSCIFFPSDIIDITKSIVKIV